jgi:hypothetical protein
VTRRRLAACGAVVAVAASVTPFTGAAPAARARFVPRIDNAWLPFVPGSTYVYRGFEDGRPSKDVVHVTRARKIVDGVRCTVVSDRLFLAARLAERTSDWYAQDARGNVWYFGEATAELDANGKVTSREGSWQAGVRGARAGIVMPAHPRVGQQFRQEYLKGQAEDQFSVLSVAVSVRTPAARSRHALLTREWTPLEPGIVDHKLYVRGIGNVAERTVKGPKERAVLVSFRRG